MEELMLSIYVATYNHEKYIVEALDSILMQKTQYRYEVLVGEDASTDNTRSVLKEYEKKHPGRFHILYREANMSKSDVSNIADLINRCKGKYVIALEGDDFWTDEYKIEKQITFLENHPEYFAVAHNCVVVGEDSKPNGESYPECKDSEYTLEHFMCDIMPGQTTTLMMRNYNLNICFDTSLMDIRIGPGDRRKYFTIISHERIYCMQEAMSAYRHITSGGSSYSATYKQNVMTDEAYLREFISYAERINNVHSAHCAEWWYMYTLLGALCKGNARLSYVISKLMRIKHKAAMVYYTYRLFVYKYILKNKKYISRIACKP